MPADAKFVVGDFVRRRVDVFDDTSEWQRGTVTDVYSVFSRIDNVQEILFDVEWLNPLAKQCGFSGHYLEHDWPNSFRAAFALHDTRKGDDDAR